jgi:membrane associated rhomboid family serine protease
MPNYPGEYAPPGLPRPGKVATVAMCLVGGLWVAFAVGMHWAGVAPEAFELFCGNTQLILHGQVWRLLTAPLLQAPDQFWHVFGVILSLYFFAVPLEKDWGRKRLTRFLIGLMLVPSLVQVFFDIALPPGVSRYFAEPYWFGGLAVSGGLTVAWALHNSGAVVRLYGILPVTARTLILLVLGAPLLYLIFRATPAEGIPALFGGPFAGWLLGGSTPSPLRRYWLKFRINRLDAEVQREMAQRQKRVERSRLKVIEGGLGKADPQPSANGEKGRGPDGRWLN